MKQITPILIYSFLMTMCFACTTSKALREERKYWGYKNWPQEFKNRALCNCILYGHRNKNFQDSMRKYDKSFYNPMAMGLFDDALEPLLKIQLEKMIIDSANSIGKSPADLKEVVWGKTVISSCTEFYNSKQLDATMRYQKKKVWPKITDVTSEIWKKVPTF
jgi:hypothetical protein